MTNKKVKSTCEERYESLTPEHKKEFDAGLKELALSELILALMEHDDISVRKLAKIAGVSPTIVQAMRSGKEDFSMKSFFKILKSLGCKQMLLEIKGNSIPLDIPRLKK